MKLSFVPNMISKPTKAIAMSAALMVPTATHSMLTHATSSFDKISFSKVTSEAQKDTAALSGKMYFLTPETNGLYLFNSVKTPNATAILTPIDGPAHGFKKDSSIIGAATKYYNDGENSLLNSLGKALSEVMQGKPASDTSSNSMRKLLDKIGNKNIYVQDIKTGKPTDCIRINKAIDPSETDGYNLITRDAIGPNGTVKEGSDRYYFGRCKDASGIDVDANGIEAK